MCYVLIQKKDFKFVTRIKRISFYVIIKEKKSVYVIEEVSSSRFICYEMKVKSLIDKTRKLVKVNL